MNFRKVSVLVAAYCAVSMVSNIASCRMLDIMGWVTDAGTLMFPLIFVIRDMIHKEAGQGMAKASILACALSNVFMFVSFIVVANAPADMSVGPQTEFGAVLLPSVRIAIASILTILVAEFVDTLVYERVAERHGRGWVPAAVSNVFSIPLDSLLIAVVGFMGTVPADAVVSIFVTNCIVKAVMTGVFLPATRERKKAKITA